MKINGIFLLLIRSIYKLDKINGIAMTEPLQILTQDAYSMAYQLLGKREDVLDVLQDAAAVALSHDSAPPRNSDEFKPWFFKVVRNRALDKLRRMQRFSHEPIQDETSVASSINEPQMQMEQIELKQDISRALSALKFEQREIVLLKDYHGFNYAEIAEVLDIPQGSVMSRLHRARMALRKILVDSRNN